MNVLIPIAIGGAAIGGLLLLRRRAEGEIPVTPPTRIEDIPIKERIPVTHIGPPVERSEELNRALDAATERAKARLAERGIQPTRIWDFGAGYVPAPTPITTIPVRDRRQVMKPRALERATERLAARGQRPSPAVTPPARAVARPAQPPAHLTPRGQAAWRGAQARRAAPRRR